MDKEDRKETLIKDIETAKKEIRAGAQRGITEREREEHLSSAIKQLSFVIGTIQIDQILDKAFGSEASMRA